MMETGDVLGESFGQTGRDEGGGGNRVLDPSRCLGGVTVAALDLVNTDTVTRLSFFKQTNASCYRHTRL